MRLKVELTSAEQVKMNFPPYPAAVLACAIAISTTGMCAHLTTRNVNEVRLLSLASGRFVQVTLDGEITANASRRMATVFNMYLNDASIQFELSDRHGLFLMLAISSTYRSVGNESTMGNATTSMEVLEQYALSAEVPTDSTYHLAKWKMMGVDSSLQQKVGQNMICKIAFNSDGTLLDPCNIQSDYRSQIVASVCITL